MLTNQIYKDDLELQHVQVGENSTHQELVAYF